MNKSLSLIIVVLLILIFGGVLLFNKPKSITQPQITPSPTILIEQDESSPSADPELLMGGSSYLDSEGRFNFLYPNDYKIDEMNNDQQVRITKIGPTQKGQTEIYDGVIMVFEAISLGEKTLSVWVDEYIKSATADESIEVTEPKKYFI